MHGLSAGQAVVQMAKGRVSKREYAIKFYVSQAEFEQEAALYERGCASTSGSLAQFLPQV